MSALMIVVMLGATGIWIFYPNIEERLRAGPNFKSLPEPPSDYLLDEFHEAGIWLEGEEISKMST